MALYEDFDLDITAGAKENGTNSDWSVKCVTVMPCYTKGSDSCDCTGDTCGGVKTRPCDR